MYTTATETCATHSRTADEESTKLRFMSVWVTTLLFVSTHYKVEHLGCVLRALVCISPLPAQVSAPATPQAGDCLRLPGRGHFYRVLLFQLRSIFRCHLRCAHRCRTLAAMRFNIRLQILSTRLRIFPDFKRQRVPWR